MDKKSEYIEFESGEMYLIDPDETFIRLACCECGLVHDIRLTLLDDKMVGFTLERNDEATEEVRAAEEAEDEQEL